MSRKDAPYNCTYENCSASFSRSDRLEVHLRIHSGERPFVCEYEGCDKSYASLSHLKRHEDTHQGHFRCTVEGCAEILKTKDTLRKHLDAFHHKKKHKTYRCTECDKEFSKHNWLQSHMFKHTGEHPYKCPVEDCRKGFLLPSKLKRHMKTHDGYKCKNPYCDEVFSKWSLYLTHLKESHPIVHKCHICEKAFSTSSNLKAHRAIHEGTRKVFPCEMPDCTRFYYAEKNLNWHVKSYHETRPYVCDREHCHKAFKSEAALAEHSLCHVRRKPRKKKKPRPSFSAILAGCADPRRFKRKPPPKHNTSDSSEEFSAPASPDEEIPQDVSTEDLSLMETTDPGEYASTTINHNTHQNSESSQKLDTSECIGKSKAEDVSSSEYETITVTIVNSVGDKNCLDSDELSSCLSDSEDIFNCNDMRASRER